MDKVTETEIAAKVIEWLIPQHWEVYQEVQVRRSGAVADILAVRDKIVWVIECKTSCTFTLLGQANDWRTHYRSIAVPRSKTDKGRATAYKIAKGYLGLGVIEVSEYGVFEEIEAPLKREHNYWVKTFILPSLVEEQKTYAKAGNNRSERYTPYRNTIDQVIRFLEANPGSTIKEIVTGIEGGHYANLGSAKGSLSLALNNWEQDKVIVDRSNNSVRYFINPDYKKRGW